MVDLKIPEVITNLFPYLNKQTLLPRDISKNIKVVSVAYIT